MTEVFLIIGIWLLTLGTFGVGFLVATLILKPNIQKLVEQVALKKSTPTEPKSLGPVLRPTVEQLEDKRNPAHKEEMDAMRDLIKEIKKQDEAI